MPSGGDANVGIFMKRPSRQWDAVQRAVEQGGPGDIIRARLAGAHEAMAHHIAGHIQYILWKRIPATANKGKRPGGQNQIDSGAWTRPVGNIGLELVEAGLAWLAGGGHETDSVLDKGRVDIH